MPTKKQGHLQAAGFRQVSLKADVVEEIRRFLDTEYAKHQHLESPRDLIERVLVSYWYGIGWIPGRGFQDKRVPDQDFWRRPI